MTRWTARRKAAFVEARRNGTLSAADALDLHGVTAEELAAWERDFAAHGEPGLRCTKLQAYRDERRRG